MTLTSGSKVLSSESFSWYHKWAIDKLTVIKKATLVTCRLETFLTELLHREGLRSIWGLFPSLLLLITSCNHSDACSSTTLIGLSKSEPGAWVYTSYQQLSILCIWKLDTFYDLIKYPEDTYRIGYQSCASVTGHFWWSKSLDHIVKCYF